MTSPAPRYTPPQLDAFTAQYEADGYVVLPQLFSESKVANWRRAFEPLFQEKVSMPNGTGQRGPGRYYVTLPFEAPFADPDVYSNPDVLAIVERIIGPDFVMTQLASDTPVRGSRDQKFHSDVPTSLEKNVQLAVNFSLIDVTEENGPMEIAPGTQKVDLLEAKRRIEVGDVPVLRLKMKAGDVLIRNVRTIHRGTANFSETPRPMVVIGYNPEAHRRPEVQIVIDEATYSKLPPQAQRLLRLSVRTNDVKQAAAAPEVYQAFAYGEFDIEKKAQ